MKAVVLFSGGLDSTVLVQQLIHDQASVRLLSINYGQRHKKELSHSSRIATSMNLPHRILDLPDLAELLSGSSLTDSSVELPEGHYAEESMKSTVVPNRNMILLAMAAGYALSIDFDTVAYAAHAGDHTIYPDCRPVFADAMQNALQLADWKDLRLHRPFVNLTKAELVRIGAKLGAPLHLTWSCYAGEESHCGKCGTCVERKEAFEVAKITDPTEYVY
ncbi:MAG: 7-cyano-7-deazaguanine synthase QueC [Verrucomicrobiota bacterium]|nr:7-cyano-7-deazaguanine synthase QueC [Verrucomicrobiota bacterium]